MGFHKSWTVEDVYRQINTAVYECSSPYNDGYTSFYVKQDLYQMLWHLEDAIKRCPTFVGEDQWLKEQEQKRLIKILKDDI